MLSAVGRPLSIASVESQGTCATTLSMVSAAISEVRIQSLGRWRRGASGQFRPRQSFRMKDFFGTGRREGMERVWGRLPVLNR